MLITNTQKINKIIPIPTKIKFSTTNRTFASLSLIYSSKKPTPSNEFKSPTPFKFYGKRDRKTKATYSFFL